MKTILIIEDQKWTQKDYKNKLEGSEITIVSAFSLEEGCKLFSETPNIDLIIIDGCVDNDEHVDSLPLIEHIRKSYQGHMIAASSSSRYRGQMILAGCNHQSKKDDVPRMVLNLLNLS